jgi:V/A-type H+/Na+-transporting ATPase subunit F
MKILVIGHPKAVLGYSLVGVAGQLATNADETNQALDGALADAEIGIILVTGDVAAMIGPRMDDLRLHSTVPLVVEIPAPADVQPEQPSLNDVVFRAIGVKI